MIADFSFQIAIGNNSQSAICNLQLFRGVAQLVEHRSPKPAVERSSRSAPVDVRDHARQSRKRERAVTWRGPLPNGRGSAEFDPFAT